MEKQILCSANAPAAIGPYSQAVKVGNTIYVSGQLPIDPATKSFSGDDAASQTRQSLENIRAVLASAGVQMDHVVKTTVYLKDMKEFSAMNQVYSQYFSGGFPARVAVEVARLPQDAKVEIEAVAVL